VGAANDDPRRERSALSHVQRVRDWYATAQCLAWALGTVSYYALPTLGPNFAFPFIYADLDSTGVSSLQDSLYWGRYDVLKSPLNTDSIQSVAGFASLHVGIILTLALVTQYTVRHLWIRVGMWVFFALTVLSTLYFGWHYVCDDIAGATQAVRRLTVPHRHEYIRVVDDADARFHIGFVVGLCAANDYHLRRLREVRLHVAPLIRLEVALKPFRRKRQGQQNRNPARRGRFHEDRVSALGQRARRHERTAGRHQLIEHRANPRGGSCRIGQAPVAGESDDGPLGKHVGVSLGQFSELTDQGVTMDVYLPYLEVTMSRVFLSASLAIAIASAVSLSAQQARPDFSGRWTLAQDLSTPAGANAFGTTLIVSQSADTVTLEQQVVHVHVVPPGFDPTIASETGGTERASYVADGADHDVPIPAMTQEAPANARVVMRSAVQEKSYRAVWTGRQLVIITRDSIAFSRVNNAPVTIRRTIRQALTLKADGTLIGESLIVADPIPGFFFFNQPEEQPGPVPVRSVYRRAQ